MTSTSGKDSDGLGLSITPSYQVLSAEYRLGELLERSGKTSNATSRPSFPSSVRAEFECGLWFRDAVGGAPVLVHLFFAVVELSHIGVVCFAREPDVLRASVSADSVGFVVVELQSVTLGATLAVRAFVRALVPVTFADETPDCGRDAAHPRRGISFFKVLSRLLGLSEAFGLDALELFGHGHVYDRSEVAPRHERLEPFVRLRQGFVETAPKPKGRRRELVPELLARRERDFVTGFRQRLDRYRVFRSYRRGGLDWGSILLNSARAEFVRRLGSYSMEFFNALSSRMSNAKRSTLLRSLDRENKAAIVASHPVQTH